MFLTHLATSTRLFRLIEDSRSVFFYKNVNDLSSARRFGVVKRAEYVKERI